MKKLAFFLACLSLLIGGLQSAVAQEPKLQAGQSFGLKLSGVPLDEQTALSGLYSIGQNGTIRLQYLDPIRAAGLRPSELAAKIEQAYKAAQIYTKPTINITISRDSGSTPMITVNGEVRSPKAIAYTVGMKMLTAIAQCGGFTDFADKKEVVLVREGKRSEHDLRRAGTSADVVLKPGDQIAVKQKRGIF